MKIIFCNIPKKPHGLREAIISTESPNETITAELTRRIRELGVGIQYICYQAPRMGDTGLCFWDNEQEPSNTELFIQVVPNVTEGFDASYQHKCTLLNACISQLFLGAFPGLSESAGGVNVEILPAQWIGLNGKQLGV